MWTILIGNQFVFKEINKNFYLQTNWDYIVAMPKGLPELMAINEKKMELKNETIACKYWIKILFHIWEMICLLNKKKNKL